MCPKHAHGRMQTHWGGGGRIPERDHIGVAELNIRERTRYLAPEKQQIYEQMMCAAMQHVMSGSIRRAQKIRPEHASVTQKITRKHQNMVICTMKIEHAEFQQTCQRMLASASNRLRMHYPTCICKHGPRVSQTPHALSMRARGTGQRHGEAKSAQSNGVTDA
jgi:hypothetical protein